MTMMAVEVDPCSFSLSQTSGNGNRNSEIPEETAFVLPLPPVDEGKTKVVDPAVCLHEDVEETPTFDGYLNRQCRQCGQNLGCRRAILGGDEELPRQDASGCVRNGNDDTFVGAKRQPVQGHLRGFGGA